MGRLLKLAGRLQNYQMLPWSVHREDVSHTGGFGDDRVKGKIELLVTRSLIDLKASAIP